MIQDSSTICAISTPAGNGAIAIIRMSGEKSYAIASKLFRPAKKDITLLPNQIQYGSIVLDNYTLDDVIISFFKSPHSYTGEDIIEISCHGSLYIQQRLLQALIDHGAIMAQPGEFTQRAFLNGKLDLSQSEAVADLIASSSEASHRVAMNQMRGGVSQKIKELREKLLHFTSLLELELDFSEEDVEFADRKEFQKLITEVKQLLTMLVESFQTGNAMKNGVPVSIVGHTNVGKSTLLNLLLKEEKAIVSDIAGTTRDAIEDTISIQGILFRFIDTAGLRETKDKIETIGIKKTREKLKQARIILILVDIRESEKDILNQIKQVQALQHQEIVVLLNKSDKVHDKELKNKKQSLLNHINYPIIAISAKEHTHIDKLIEQLMTSAHIQSMEQDDVVITNMRHYQAFQKALENIIRAKEGLEKSISSDLIAMDIRQVLHYLGEITGEITTDEILGNIFRNFCIGK